MRLNPLEIEGFAQAVYIERLVRDSAFLRLNETVCGFELRPMTLRDYIILRIANNPLLGDELPSPAELTQFLWTLSVGYSRSRLRRIFFGLRVNRACAYPLKAARLIDSCREYRKEAMQDAPGTTGRTGYRPSYYSDCTYWYGLLAREYGCTMKEVLDMPLKILFQLPGEIKDHHDSKQPKCNPSDKILADYSRKQSELVKQ